MLNLETIGATIIEVHLRFADQWPDLYGAGWVEAVARLYETGRGISPMPIGATATAWSCSARTDVRYRHPPAALIDEIRRIPGISSVQITFHEDLPPERHAMPPGGFRLAVDQRLRSGSRTRRARAAQAHFLGLQRLPYAAMTRRLGDGAAQGASKQTGSTAVPTMFVMISNALLTGIAAR